MEAMARVCSSASRLPLRYLLHTSTTGKPSPSNNPPSHQELDFMKATDILFSEAPKEKKFGWDFHLWQFFVACLPSFAVYLTAQYARREMKRMEEERERENAEKLKTEEKDRKEETQKLPGFQTLEARLDAMEEKIREMELRTSAKTIAGGQVRDGQLKSIEIEKNTKNVKTGESDTQNVVIKVAKAPETVSQSVHSEEEPKDKPHESKQNGNPEKKGDSQQQNVPSKEELKETMKDAEKIQK